MSRKLLMKLEQQIKSSDPKDLQYAMYVHSSKHTGVTPVDQQHFMGIYDDREEYKQALKDEREAQEKSGNTLNSQNSEIVRHLNRSRGRMNDKMRELADNMGEFYNNYDDYMKAEEALQKEHDRTKMKTKERKKKTVI